MKIVHSRIFFQDHEGIVDNAVGIFFSSIKHSGNIQLLRSCPSCMLSVYLTLPIKHKSGAVGIFPIHSSNFFRNVGCRQETLQVIINSTRQTSHVFVFLCFPLGSPTVFPLFAFIFFYHSPIVVVMITLYRRYDKMIAYHYVN